jgi:predicted Zn-dependent protease
MENRLLWAVSAIALTAMGGSSLSSKTSRPLELATSISAKDKAEGAKAHPELMAEFGGAYDGPQAAYVTSVGRKIASQSSLSKVQSDFTVTLLNSSVNNAFAIPGGYVYITRQLMALCNDEAEMAGVLGHEVGHVAALHSQRRQKAATRTAIGGVLLQVLTGAVLGNSGFGSILQKGIGTGAQLLTLKFSRAQEYEADDLGVRYLTSAGYDPKALSGMLASLAAQSSLDAKFAGRADSIPEWASTHPDPGARVARALQNANATGSRNILRNRDPFLNALNGVLYGDDPKQGVVEGSQFLHPDLKIAFTAPAGYGMSNGTQAVSITGSGGQAQFTGAAYSGDLDAYIRAAFTALAKDGSVAPAQITRTTVNGVTAAYATARANASSGPVDVTIFAYELDPKTAFHFVILTAAGQGMGPLQSLAQSFRRLSPTDAAAIKPRRIAVVAAKSGDTIQSMAARMAFKDYQTERFLTLNALTAQSTLKAGQRVKIVTY